MLYLISLLCGVLFGLGLIVSGMINPAKVLNFLDVTGQWDPTLGLVFMGALAVAMPLYQWGLRRHSQPVAAEDFKVPKGRSVTLSLIGGSALFGIGWGLAGFCPGPGITSLASLLPGSIVFVIGLFAGAIAYRFLLAR
ncbi:DUF6691 family protein [Bowmanella dokdonensis]|nr:DUF6691 family protein [Bowmanella dokdonensis]